MNWIKCSDKLPDLYREVVVYDGKGIDIGELVNDEEMLWNSHYRYFNRDNITHWAELPQGPE